MNRASVNVDRPRPQPTSATPANSPVLRHLLAEWAIVGLFIIVAFAVMRLMAALLMPMVAAIVIGSVLVRGGNWVARFGIAPIVSGLGIVILTGLAIFLLGSALVEAVPALVAEAPTMLKTLSEAVTPLIEPLSKLKGSLLSLSGSGVPVAVNGNDMGWLTDFLSSLTPALGEFFVFLTTLIFFVAGRMRLRRHAVMVWREHGQRLKMLRIINAIEEVLVLYFSTAAMTYAATGAVTALIAFESGLPRPIQWGAMAFTASFIPYFGAGAITLALMSGGLMVHHEILWGIVPALVYLVFHGLVENVVVPVFVGRRLDLNPFVVFIAIVFWSWMWGPFGAMLAVPLLLVADTARSELTAKYRDPRRRLRAAASAKPPQSVVEPELEPSAQ